MIVMKKGEISTTMIATFVIAIVGFSILLAFLYNMYFQGIIDDEACHQSVVFRATLPVFGNAKSYVPLKCKTDKICVTAGFRGECSEFRNEKGVTKVKVKNVEQVEKLIAQNIIECWSMMGEGKVGIFSDYWATTFGLGQVYSSCVVCNRIAFDKVKLQKAGVDLSKMDVITYMQRHIMPSKNYTYYAYLLRDSPPGRTPVTAPAMFRIESIDEDGKLNASDEYVPLTVVNQTDKNAADQATLQYKELSITFMQVAAPKYSDVLKNDLYALLGIAAGSTAILGPTAMAKGASSVSAGAAWFAGASAAVIGAYQMGSVAWNRAVTTSYCGDVSLGDSGSNGCSVVRTSNYEPSELRQYCRVFENLP